MGNGKKKLAWVKKTTHAANHYLDAEVYAYAAADIMGVRSLHLEEMDEKERMAVKQKTQMEEDSPEESWIKANEHWIEG